MEDLILKTCLINDKKYKIKNVRKIDHSKFTPLSEMLDKDVSGLDPEFLDGVLLMSYQDKILMDYSYWDDITDLWHYFINSIEELQIASKSYFTFPSQPLPVSIELNADRIKMTIDKNSINIDAKSFFAIMIQEAIDFFSRLKILFPRHELEYSLALNRIEKIKAELGEKK